MMPKGTSSARATHRIAGLILTTRQEITMTTSIRIEICESAQASGFRFVRSPNVAAVSIIGCRDSLSVSLRTVLNACVERLEVLFSEWRASLRSHRRILFAATACSVQYNALDRRSGIWGSEGMGWLPTGAPRSPSVEIGGKQGTRFAGLAEITASDLFDAADYARTHSGSCLLVSPELNLAEARVRSFVANSFPKGELALDWTAVIEPVQDSDEIRIRAAGGFDDREASLDVFLSTDLLHKLVVR